MELSLCFPHLNNYALDQRAKREFITDKKTGCVYHIVSRYKNNDRRYPGDNNNTEVLTLEIDPNLSPNFSIEEIDLVSGGSITCNLTALEQPRWGDTELTMSVFYVDEAQTLQESVRTFCMKSIGGTITKRLELALATFRKEATATIAKIHSRGFTHTRRGTASYYASYIVLRAKELDAKRHKWDPKILYDVWTGYNNPTLNTIIYLYSMLNDDFLHKGQTIGMFHNHFLETQIGNWQPRKFNYTEQEIAELDAIMEYYRMNRDDLNKLIKECSNGYPFDEQRFRANLKISKHTETTI